MAAAYQHLLREGYGQSSALALVMDLACCRLGEMIAAENAGAGNFEAALLRAGERIDSAARVARREIRRARAA